MEPVAAPSMISLFWWVEISRSWSPGAVYRGQDSTSESREGEKEGGEASSTSGREQSKEKERFLTTDNAGVDASEEGK